MVSTISVMLEELIKELPQGVRFHEWIPGHVIPVPPPSDSGIFFDTYQIALETIPKSDGNSTVCIFEIVPTITKEELAELIKNKSAELLAIKG